MADLGIGWIGELQRGRGEPEDPRQRPGESRTGGWLDGGAESPILRVRQGSERVLFRSGLLWAVGVDRAVGLGARPVGLPPGGGTRGPEDSTGRRLPGGPPGFRSPHVYPLSLNSNTFASAGAITFSLRFAVKSSESP